MGLTECLFFVWGCCTLTFCALEYFEAYVYQASRLQRFGNAPQSSTAASAAVLVRGPRTDPVDHVRAGYAVGRIDIPRIGVSAVVVEGVTPWNLRLAVGHVP